MCKGTKNRKTTQNHFREQLRKTIEQLENAKEQDQEDRVQNNRISKIMKNRFHFTNYLKCNELRMLWVLDSF